MRNGPPMVQSLTPGAAELAMLASLAGRVEPQLVRALRLELAPHRTAADEADLWFSDVVETAAATGLVFRPEAQSILQNRLANDPQCRLEQAWALLFRLRTGAAYRDCNTVRHATWLQVQEELTYWATRGGPTTADDSDRIETLWGWVRNSLDDDGKADALAWIRTTRVRLPATAWSLPGASMIAQVLPPVLRQPRSLWVRRVQRGLELAEVELAGGHVIEMVAPLGSIRVDLVLPGRTPADGQGIVVGRAPVLFPTDAAAVDLYLPDGLVVRAEEDVTSPQERLWARSRSVVSVYDEGQARLTGVVVSPRHVLTTAHALRERSGGISPRWNWDLRVTATDGTGGIRSAKGRTLIHSPLRGSPQLPEPFGPAADDLALIELAGDITDLAVASTEPVVSTDRPLVGREVVAVLTSGGENEGPFFMRGTVESVSEEGFGVRFARVPPPGSSGTPVWDEDGLLGLAASARHGDELTFVVPARPLGDLLGAVQRRVLVVGTGRPDLPPEAWRVAGQLGQGLARAGYVLVCGGWPGVDHVVARAFVESLDNAQPLEQRLVQLVEEYRKPDFHTDVEPRMIPEGIWAEAMVAECDVVVALGGNGGVAAVCDAADRAGVPVIAVPGTGGDAENFAQGLRDWMPYRAFPDWRALQRLSGEAASLKGAASVADGILDLLGDCVDPNIQARYRACAEGVAELAASAGLALDKTRGALRDYLTALWSAAGWRREDNTVAADRAAAIGRLRATLPGAARWLAWDFIFLDSQASGFSETRPVQAGILRAVLDSEPARQRLIREVRHHDRLNPKTYNRAALRARIVSMMKNWEDIDHDSLNVLSEELIASITSGLVADELRPLSEEFLGPISMDSFNVVHRRLFHEAEKRLDRIKPAAIVSLIESHDSVLRVIGYTFFLLGRQRSVVSALENALSEERRFGEASRETRPLGLLLQCLRVSMGSDDLRTELSHGLGVRLADVLRFLQSRKDIDPGRECTALLQHLVGHSPSPSAIRFGTYSRLQSRRETNQYGWCVFVDAEPDVLDGIREVEYVLHESIRNPVRRVRDRDSCFAVESQGWGEFRLEITVRYKSGGVDQHSHLPTLASNTWPMGPALHVGASERARKVYAALCDRRWNWRHLDRIAADAGMSEAEATAVLHDLVRGNFVRKARFQSRDGGELWGATARIGLMPQPSTVKLGLARTRGMLV